MYCVYHQISSASAVLNIETITMSRQKPLCWRHHHVLRTDRVWGKPEMECGTWGAREETN